MNTYITAPTGHEGSTHTVEIAIVNSGFGGMRLGRGVGGAIPRERVRRLAAGRRSVRRRRRALARWLRVPADEPEAVNLDGPVRVNRIQNGFWRRPVRP